MTKSRAAAVAAAILLFAAGAAGAAEMVFADRIELNAGPQVPDIRITGATVDKVTYTRFAAAAPYTAGPEQTIDAKKVKDIFWGESPGDLRRALAEYKKEDFGRALPYLEKLPDTLSAARDFWYVPYKNLIHAECLVGTGKAADALSKFAVVTDKYPTSFYFLDAVQGEAKAHMVAETLRKLDPNEGYANPNTTEPYGKLWQLRARLGMADAYVKTPGEEGAAAKIYDGLASVTATLLGQPPEALKNAVPELRTIQQNALVGKALVLIALGKLDEAEKWINEVADKVTDKTARLGLFAALGDLSMKAAKDAKGEEQKARYKKALMAYMRVYILYPDQTALRPAAMYNAGVASELLDTPADKARAVRLYKELAETFPGAPEAKQAGARLEVFGVKIDKK